MKNILCVLFCLVLQPLMVFSQNNSLYVNKLTKDDGLPSNKINCIIQDQSGFMWFGTDNGLCRYDGYSFKTFTRDVNIPGSLSYSAVNCIVEEKETGNLWVGTTTMDYFDKKANWFTNKTPHLKNMGTIATYCLDSQGNNANNKPVLELEIGIGTTANIAVTGIGISSASLNLNTGQTGQLTAIILPTDATNTNVSWSSSNTSVATVDANGVVSAQSGGNTTITATTEDGGFAADCSVTVTVPVTGVSVIPTSLSIEIGGSSNLTETISPADASDKSVVWSSSNSTVATVDNNGLVSAQGEGQATITVTTNNGNFTASCIVTVTAPQFRTESIAASTDDIEIRSNGGAAYIGLNNTGWWSRKRI